MGWQYSSWQCARVCVCACVRVCVCACVRVYVCECMCQCTTRDDEQVARRSGAYRRRLRRVPWPWSTGTSPVCWERSSPMPSLLPCGVATGSAPLGGGLYPSARLFGGATLAALLPPQPMARGYGGRTIYLILNTLLAQKSWRDRGYRPRRCGGNPIGFGSGLPAARCLVGSTDLAERATNYHLIQALVVVVLFLRHPT